MHQRSPFELNRPGENPFLPKGEPAQIKIAPHGKTSVCWLVRRIFPPQAGILIRHRSLGVTSFIRNFLESGRTGISPRFAGTVLEIAPEGGLG
jgi:hypothetical protein